MCELFGMASASPSRVVYALDEFSQHGGQSYRNKDGWGIALYQPRDAYLFKEPEPASDSALAKLVSDNAHPAKYLIAHVRLATSGEPALENTHPFRRTQHGRVHHFAHNGELHGLKEQLSGKDIATDAIGDTDSELAFLDLLDRLSASNGGYPETVEARFDIFAVFAEDMAKLGSANFLYSDGEALFVHAHKRRYELPDGTRSEPRAPGLHMRNCFANDDGEQWQTGGAEITDLDPHTILFASVPLNDHGWEELPEGCAIVISDGHEVARRRTIAG